MKKSEFIKLCEHYFLSIDTCNLPIDCKDCEFENKTEYCLAHKFILDVMEKKLGVEFEEESAKGKK